MKIVIGFSAGVPFQLLIDECHGVWLEPSTALRFRLMHEAAKSDGVDLIPTQGFRSNDEQTAIWKSRQCTCARKPGDKHSAACVVAIKGPAARPGYSLHQSGRAVDIRTGLSVSDFAKGKRSKVYSWLEKNAARFGFARTVPSEPWHWEDRGLQESRDD
jgi:LAS superfamily LD-carboxypeptidase LdcB